MSPPPVCARCGGSCEGLRARVDPGERAAIAEHARILGVERPVSGAWVRQVWGRCVFLDGTGCRLHAVFGPSAKPRVCRTFPTLAHGDVDPACFHDGAPAEPWPDGLIALQDLSCGLRIRSDLERLPLAAVLDGPALGPMSTEALRPLLGPVDPVVPPEPDRSRASARMRVVIQHVLAPGDPSVVRGQLAGGVQLLAGAGVPLDRGFPAWARLLRTGVL